MQLQLNDDYKITSDPMNIFLEKRRIVKEGERKGQADWDILGSYPDIEWAFRACVKHGLLADELNGLTCIMNYLSCIHKDVKFLADKLDREGDSRARR